MLKHDQAPLYCEFYGLPLVVCVSAHLLYLPEKIYIPHRRRWSLIVPCENRAVCEFRIQLGQDVGILIHDNERWMFGGWLKYVFENANKIV